MKITELSYWERKSYFKDLDFLIVGAGIVGYSTALHLQDKNPQAKILIVERGILPSGASSKNAGFACFGSATELNDDLAHIDENEVWNTLELRWKGLNKLRALIGDGHLKIKTNGSWDLITSNEIEIFENTQEKISYFNKVVSEITGENKVFSIDEKVGERFGLKSIITSIHNKLEGQIDTSSMNNRFYQLVIEKGIKVMFGVEVTDLHDNASIACATTNIGEIEAKRIAICTNGFAHKLLTDLDVKPARAQVLITSPIPDLKVKGTFHYDRGYYYFRNIDNRILLGGGRNLDFKNETTTELVTTDLIMNRLRSILNEVILPNSHFTIEGSWAGVMGVGKSKMPIVKQVSTNVFCGVRLGGMGVAIGTLIGEQTSELLSSK